MLPPLNVLQDYAKIALEEVENSDSEYFHPVSSKHHIFEQVRMKFLNRNLNYFNFESMVAQTTEDDPFNTQFPKTLEFCDFSRTFTNTHTPYGRMCIWYIPPKTKILPHLDNFVYHRHIVRNIFVLSKNTEGKHLIIINGKNINSFDGLYFQFNPATEVHTFANLSDEPYYFLGYDFWIKDKLDSALATVDIQSVINNPTRLTGFGADGTQCKYMSSH